VARNANLSSTVSMGRHLSVRIGPTYTLRP
jgi:hypothetical protein